jgi:acyl CoA:acetate/3-ketoacid CoA transferase alpha subunit
MTHIAMQQADEHGNVVTWGDHVTDDQYAAAPAPTADAIQTP